MRRLGRARGCSHRWRKSRDRSLPMYIVGAACSRACERRPPRCAAATFRLFNDRAVRRILARPRFVTWAACDPLRAKVQGGCAPRSSSNAASQCCIPTDQPEPQGADAHVQGCREKLEHGVLQRKGLMTRWTGPRPADEGSVRGVNPDGEAHDAPADWRGFRLHGSPCAVLRS